MKANDFRNEAVAFVLVLLCVSTPQRAYAGGEPKGGGAKNAPAKTGAGGKVGSGVKPTPPAPAASASNQNTSGGTVGDGLTGSQLTGSEFTGSQLTGSQLTGFNADFGSPLFSRSSFPIFAADSFDFERNHRRSFNPDAGQTPNYPPETIAPAGDNASDTQAYNNADTQLRSAQTDYDAALARVRVRLNQNATYQKAHVRQSDSNPAPTTTPSADGAKIDAAKTIAEMEREAVAADPAANAARQNLDAAVLSRNSAERAKAAPRATANASGD